MREGVHNPTKIEHTPNIKIFKVELKLVLEIHLAHQLYQGMTP